MLMKKQVIEIREHLEKAQNPVFFFDNDQDGLCSFLLLQRFIGRGKGVAVRSFPEMDAAYFQRAQELEADYIFILDKAVVAESFFEEVEKYNIPVVWIDHHETQCKIPKFVNYYNPFLEDGNNEAVASFCYQVTQKKDDLWIAVVGCVSDYFLPEFYADFKTQYPDLAIDSDEPFEIYYDSEIGKIAQILGAGLKDKVTNVVQMMKFLMRIKTPYEIFDEANRKYNFYKRFEEINKKYEKFLKKALEENEKEKIIFFKYGGDTSMSCALANALKHKLPRRIIFVGYKGESKINISGRGKKIRDRVLKVLKGFENSTGGGHEDAIGMSIRKEDWERFRKEVRKALE